MSGNIRFEFVFISGSFTSFPVVSLMEMEPHSKF